MRTRAVCRVSERDATSSDHRALKLKLHGNFITADGRHGWRKKPPKPIGWRCHDFTFASRVGEDLEVDRGPNARHDERSDATSFHLWTDGSFKKSRHGSPGKGGWGVALFKQGITKSTKEEQLAEAGILFKAFGPVSLDASSAWYLGASKVSNGTAELQAVAESLFFLLRVGRERTEQRDNLSEDPVTPSNLSILNVFPSNEFLNWGTVLSFTPVQLMWRDYAIIDSYLEKILLWQIWLDIYGGSFEIFPFRGNMDQSACRR